MPGAEGSRGRVCLRGLSCLRVRVCPSGIPRPRHNAPALGLQGYPSFDLLAASILKSWLEIGNRCKDCPCFDLFAASIRKSGLEIENRCTDCPRFNFFAASIRKFELEIENRCTEVPGMCSMAAAIAKLTPLKSRIAARKCPK